MESEKMGNRKKRQHHRSSMLLTWHFAVCEKKNEQRIIPPLVGRA